ncbi:MAG: AAA family ATPase, partial [Clostridia bacterium]|nr:AAA family ATPase [Clostridia bacterium]
MTYLTQLTLPSDNTEFDFLRGQKRTCYGTIYPFKVFPQKQLQYLDFSPVTILYGGNGSGKTTLLNVIAELIGAIRHSQYNKSPFFEQYVELCRIYGEEPPQSSQMLSSDDVFDYVINMRYLNENVDFHREELFRG